MSGKIMRRVLAVLLCAGLLLPAGCSKKGAKKPLAQQMKIAVALADMQRDGNQTLKQVMEKRAKDENVRISWLDAKNDPREQEKQLSGLGQKKIKAVVLQAVDPAAAPRLVQQMVQQNVKVVALETLPANTPVDAYVASDHVRAGQLQARFVTEALNQAAGTSAAPRVPAAPGPGPAGPGGGGGQAGGSGGGGKSDAGSSSGQSGSGGKGASDGQGGGGGSGKSSSGGQGGPAGGAQITPPGAQLPARRPVNVVILQGDPRDTAAQEIAGAARAALAGEPRARVVQEAAQPLGDPRLAALAVQDALSKYNNQIDAVLATDSRLAMAAVEVLKAAGLNNRVLTVGVGADQQASQALVSGEHDAEVDTRPDLLGQYALDAAVGLDKTGHWQYDTQVSNGDYNVPARIIPVRLIQNANAYLLQQRRGKGKGGGQGQAGGGNPGDGSGGGSDAGGGQQGGGGEQGGQAGGGKQKPDTTLRITTQDGKTVEVHIKGEVKKIESVEGGKPGGAGQQMPSGGGGAGGAGGGGAGGS